MVEHIDPSLDPGIVASHAFIHDVAETIVGDNPVYDPVYGADEKRLVDEIALGEMTRRFASVSEWCTRTLLDYSSLRSPESRYVYAWDKILPFLLILHMDLHPSSPTMNEYLVTEEVARQKVRTFPGLSAFFETVAAEMRSRDHLFQAEQVDSQGGPVT